VQATYIENPLDTKAIRRALIWRITAPTATHEINGDVEILDGPLFIQVKDSFGNLLGTGSSEQQGPALRREKDVWFGLAPLHWVQMDEPGRGEYFLPTGWRKESDDRFVVENGPVVWNSTEMDIVRSLSADSLNARDLVSGTLKNVQATLEGEGTLGGGQIWAEQVEVDETELHFLQSIRIDHRLGWRGTATSGYATRPDTPESLATLQLHNFRADGILDSIITHRNYSGANVRQVRANETKWTKAGLEMDGDVQWDLDVSEINGNKTRYLLTAQKTFYRGGEGDEIPENVPLGAIRSEGSPKLTWNDNTLNSQTMTYFSTEQSWQLEGIVSGTMPGGFFSSGSAFGSVSDWVFNGPIRVDYRNWGTLRGNRLVWNERPEPVSIFTGNPAVLTGIAHRFAGEKIIHTGDKLQFTSGIQGNINYQGETFTIRADNAEVLGKSNGNGSNASVGRSGISLREIRLRGRVECSAQNYRFSSREATIAFENNRPVKIMAKGRTLLQGSLGSGSGESMELVFEQGNNQPKVSWSGQVRGEIEVFLDR
jgi:hypothetical protein